MKKIALFDELAEILKQPIAGVDFSIEQKECERCGKLFEELNDNNLCTDCEEWYQQEKISIENTNESLKNL